MKHRFKFLVLIVFVGLCGEIAANEQSRQVSGIYPHLAMFNDENECGTGAVVVWAERLWAITYAPHKPFGSSDKLYEITPDLKQIVRPESVGGTPANRMIHRETGQLLIGPYVIDAKRNVRVLSSNVMPGRPTGNARHLDDPHNKIYYATMEEGLYEVDLRNLEVTCLIKDGNDENGRVVQPAADQPASATVGSHLPGYHGKGLYSGQGVLIYANNGEHGAQARQDPMTPSGALAQWQPGGDWQLLRRNQFTEVTGPGGIYGNETPETDPLWTIGWDAKSLILMVLDAGRWHSYRLPKASHCYDGAHGWNTEWPRIREIGEHDLLMTMHGTFWKFPNSFSASQSAGIVPRSTYLKVIGDFTRWNDRIVFGCDDTARSEFLNKRRAKGNLAAPGQSQSNLWFVEPATIDQLGPSLGRGAVWLAEDVSAGQVSDPYLFNGYAYRLLHVTHEGTEPLALKIEVDKRGDGTWQTLRSITVPPGGYTWTSFSAEEAAPWVRLKAPSTATKVTAFFYYRGDDRRGATADPIFAALADPGDTQLSGGLLHARGDNQRVLRFAAMDQTGDISCYDLDAQLRLAPVDDSEAMPWMKANVAIPEGVLTTDAASVFYVDDQGRWRLPKGAAALDEAGLLGDERICREVCTERDLFNAHGTFYELPADNAGGFAKIRPIATHNRRIKDYASYRGLLVISGLKANATGEHVVRSTDDKCALWVGAVDDLWKLGKPRGYGGPWKDSPVKAGRASDPYLMAGYDQKQVTLRHASDESVSFRIEVDLTGDSHWATYGEFPVEPGEAHVHQFPREFGAYWVRVVADRDTVATAEFIYD